MMQYIPRSMELERRRSKKKEDDESRIHRMQKEECNSMKGIRTRKKRYIVFRIQGRKEKKMVELERSGVPQAGKSIAERHMNRGSKKCSKRRREAKRSEENIQNAKESIARYRSGKDRYI